MVPLKYLSNFWKTLKMLLINWKVNYIPPWSVNCVLSHVAANQATTFAVTDKKSFGCNFFN